MLPLRVRLDRGSCCLYFLVVLPGLCLAGLWALSEHDLAFFWTAYAAAWSAAFFVPPEKPL